jgi:hypothetical protein
MKFSQALYKKLFGEVQDEIATINHYESAIEDTKIYERQN